MEEDIDSKENKLELKKETEKYCKSLLITAVFARILAEEFHTAQHIGFAEGHPSQPDLPPEA